MKITWVLVLNSSGPNGPMNQREDYHEAMHKPQRKHTTRLFLDQVPRLVRVGHDAKVVIFQVDPEPHFCFFWFASEDHNFLTHGDDDVYSGMTSKTGLSEWSRRKQ